MVVSLWMTNSTVQFQARTVPKPWMESWELPLKECNSGSRGIPMRFGKNGRDPPKWSFWMGNIIIYIYIYTYGNMMIKQLIWGNYRPILTETNSCSELRQVKFFDTLQAGGIQLLEVGGVFGICNVMPGWAPIISDLWWYPFGRKHQLHLWKLES